ncbi:hypothetical protein [Pseudolactococcus insecticola]|uniref:Uncharacterized protein n=1 Tax=Pseudolactococcus insecticola TaxID=2709158 RepID=A0A6A0B3V2_9LACT|nr:hypothetical protein [Lactococcus insecticola]GFH39832.1 hypothetical protein Hs20B_02300 [Lactococcus insecticola]
MTEQKYDKEGLCPACGSIDLSDSHPQYDRNICWFETTCLDCNTKFDAKYFMIFTDNEILKGERK